MATLPIAMKSPAESTDTITELLWQDALRHLKSTNNEVLLPINVTDMIGQVNVDKIKVRLGALIGAPVVAFVDESIKALRVMRTPAFSGTAISVASHGTTFEEEDVATKLESVKPRTKRAGSAKPLKVPRPPNAFILYRQQHHPKIKEAYPDFSNNDISVMLGKQWKSEPEEIKAQFRNRAEDMKKKHAEEHPDYHYTPRKPSEKKRRASSRQLARNTKSIGILNSSTPTNGIPDPSTSTMLSGMTMGHTDYNGSLDDNTDVNIIMASNGLPESQQFQFEPNGFDFIQQVQNEYNRASFFQQLNIAEGPLGESFEFSDFITDCF